MLDILWPINLSLKGRNGTGATAPNAACHQFACIRIGDDGRRLLDELECGSRMGGQVPYQHTPIFQGKMKDGGDHDGIGRGVEYHVDGSEEILPARDHKARMLELP